MDRSVFFQEIRKLLIPNLNQSQVQGTESILNYWDSYGLTDLRWLAYMLGTTYWETARTMMPIAEYGKGYGRVYGRPDPRSGQTYYGRGYVQLTWYDNYRVMGDLLGVDLVNNPDLAMNPDIAAKVMFEGMILGKSGRGDFTGKALEHYFNNQVTDWINARRIINGMDKAVEIANISKKFYEALLKADENTPNETITPQKIEPPVNYSLKFGDKSIEVKNVQESLNIVGYNLTPDGDFGPRTLQAVKDFQTDNGLEVTGVIDPTTRAAIILKAAST